MLSCLLVFNQEFISFVWLLQEAMETMIACSAMAIVEEQSKKEEAKSEESSWAKWKRGGIIGAAAVTGGALMAITGGAHMRYKFESRQIKYGSFSLLFY